MLRSLVFWLSLPFVAVQAVRVRRSAMRIGPAGGPDSGSVGFGPSLSVLAIGDSIIAGVGASSLDKALVGRSSEFLAASLGCKVDWRAMGRSGIDSTGVLNELVPKIPNARVDVFLVSVGVNDITSLTRTSTWTLNLDGLLSALIRHSPGAVIAVAGIPPLGCFPLLPQPLRGLIGYRGESLDRLLRKLIERHPQALHVPVDFETGAERFCSDGFHPSEASYIEFGRTMANRVALKLASER